MPLAVIEQCGVRDLSPAFTEVKGELELAPVKLECGIVDLVLMSHVVNQTAGRQCPDAQLHQEPWREQDGVTHQNMGCFQ